MDRLFHIETLGCKLNQLDSERIRSAFYNAGYVETDDPSLASVLLVNACSVTANAERESRYRFRRLKRLNPDATCYLVGCFPTSEHREQDELPADQKFNIPELAETVADYPDYQKSHVRPLVHIQTGCDLHCSYCIVPAFRGPSRSVPEADVLHQLRLALSAGRKEAVLTGIHIGTWGRDLSPARSLLDLLQYIERELPDSIAIRISSLDSNEISTELAHFVQHADFIRPHFHLPLQSGSASILRSMRRRYTPDQFMSTVTDLRIRIPHACLGADIIVGFPGEEDVLFEETRTLIDQSPLDYLHVFPFSPRPGTPAAELPDQVPPHVRKKRVKILKDMSRNRRRRFAGQFLKTTRTGIVIYPDVVLTDNYISVELEKPCAQPPGDSVQVYLNTLKPDGTAKGSVIS